MTITTKVPVEAEAKLVLVPEFGPKRDATVADLRKMGFVKGLDVYSATDLALARIMGVTDEDRMDLTRWRDGDTIANLVRYFIETSICYHDLGSGDYPSSYEEMADRIVAHFTQDDGDGNYGTRLRAALGDCQHDEAHEYQIGQQITVNGSAPATLTRINPTFPTQGLVELGDGSWTTVDFENDKVEAV